MSYMQGRGVRIDRHLTNIALSYTATGFIADMVFPVAQVQKQSGVIATFSQADLFRRENTKRSPGAEANKVSYQVGSASYYANNYALKEDVTIEDRANADPIFINQLETGRVNRVMQSLMIDWEVRVATAATATTAVGTSAAVGSAWTDFTNSDPIGDVQSQINNVHDATAYRPNRIVFGEAAWRNFRENDTVIDKARATGISGGGLNITESLAETLFEVEKVSVGRLKYNTAQEGIAQSLTDAWGDHVLVYYAPAAPSIEVPSFGYSLRWSGNGLANMSVERHPFDPKTKTDEIEIGYYQDELILSSALGALVTNVTSST